MMKSFKHVVVTICMMMLALASIVGNKITVQAASTRKCYTISSGNTTVYSNSGLTKKLGIIYGSDEITVLSVYSRYTYVQYPVKNGTKKGYIYTSSILKGTSGATYTCSKNITTYKRPGGASYGSVSSGDKVIKLGTSGNYTQIKYPVSFGYKYAWISGDIPNGSMDNGYASISENTYTIATALNNSYVLDVNNNATFNGGNVEIYPYHQTNNEHWKITSLGGGYYRIQDVNSGKSLDVNGGGSASETNVQIWENNNTNAQKWRFYSAGNGYYYIKNANGCYLDVQGGIVKNGNNVWVYSGNNSNAQKWKLNTISSPSNTSSSVNLSYGLYKKTSAYISCGFDGYKNTKGRHEGIDIQGGNGSAIYSLTDGVVTRITYGKRGSGGLSTIAIYDSSENKTVVYLHSYPTTLKVGQVIQRGQYLGCQDWRGVSSSSGGHTHVEVVNGKATAAKKSVNDYNLENSNPTSYWQAKGYYIK